VVASGSGDAALVCGAVILVVTARAWGVGFVLPFDFAGSAYDVELAYERVELFNSREWRQNSGFDNDPALSESGQLSHS
jgi:hypothetical protein